MHYSGEDKRVIYKPIDLTQDFRDFDFESPWDLPDYEQLLSDFPSSFQCQNHRAQARDLMTKTNRY